MTVELALGDGESEGTTTVTDVWTWVWPLLVWVTRITLDEALLEPVGVTLADLDENPGLEIPN